ncbi:MAG TPA: gliding motility-associated C-terminal domain-containing protein [Bacteroidia bacterium]
MKKFILLFLILLSCMTSRAQEIHYSVYTVGSDCNGASNGRAAVNVVSENPPYTYQWQGIPATGNSATGLAPGTYQLTVTDSAGADTTLNITIAEIKCVITAEMAFTPNGDGYNDSWSVYELEHYSNHLVLVYNRWGQKVFEQSGVYEPWEGRDLLGVPVPDSSYFYIIYGNRDDEESIIKGTVTIIR